MSRGFSGANEWNHLPVQEIAVELFILDGKKWTNVYLKNDNGKLWVEEIIAPFLEAII